MGAFSIYEKPDDSNLDIESALQVIENHSALPVGIKKRLSKLCEVYCKDAGDPNTFSPSRIVEMNEVVSKMLTRLVDGDNELLSTATLRDISSTVGAITSLLRLFDSSQKKVDHAREVEELFNAVMSAISRLTPSQQKPFFDELENPKWGMHFPKCLDGDTNDE